MPLVPKTLSVEPVYYGNISVDEGYNTDYVNQQSYPFMNDFSAHISSEELDEISQTLHVNMVSETFNNNDLTPSISTITTSSVSTVRNGDSNTICGVVIVDERSSSRLNQNNDYTEPYYKNAIVIGSVVLEQCNYTGEELRRCMHSQLPSVPQKFTFLTKEGWPVLRSQESKYSASNLINRANIIAIRKSFDKPRVGIVNTNGNCFGFVFIEYIWTLRQLRDTIDAQLKEIGAKSQRLDYKFIEKNGWPVAPSQELLLNVIDIIVNNNICIQSSYLSISNISNSTLNVNAINQEQAICALPPPQFGNSDDNVNNSAVAKTDMLDSVSEIWRRRPPSNSRKSGFGLSALSFRQTTRRKQEKVVKVKESSKNQKSNGKPIMISYARQEAAQHALDLKKVLVSLGFSVYLDVHEIQTGSDWQDSLNDAVRGCEIFLPLVTPMYGKTQWTNREVKCADILKKYILPINFLDQWPPECLAIQFATTQYIYWRPSGENDHESPIEKSIPDIKCWSFVYIDRVSKLVAEQIKKIKIFEEVPSPKPAIQSAPVKTQTNLETVKEEPTKFEFNDKPLIVISAHPQQRSIVAEIKTALTSEGYNIWCSTDLPEGGLLEDDSSSVNTEPFTPNQLPTILEHKESPFSDAYKDIARRIVESNKQRPYSLPPSENNSNEVLTLKKTVMRMMSQGSDLCPLTSLTIEKRDHLKQFQDQVSLARVVLVIASSSYFKSRTSYQHVYYCESRKKMILIRCDASPPPSWYTMLMGNDFEINTKNPRYIDLIKSHIKRTLNPASKIPNDDMHEAKMQYLVNFMKKNLPVLETCIYIVGSSKLQNQRSEEICKAIGTELAKVKNVQVVTSGFYGAGDLVASAFNEVRSASNSVNFPKNSFETCDSVVHILPVKDSQNLSSKCRQNADGSFEPLPYGKTLFLGESVKERESAVARLLDTCILIEGGPGSAHEIQEFIWNDHFVIPVISTGGAASGQYNVPVKIFDAPNGVSQKDWDIISNQEAEPIDVAKAIVRIVMALKEAIATHALSRLEMTNKLNKAKTKVRRSTKKKHLDKKRVEINTAMSIVNIGQSNEPNSPEKVLPVIEAMSVSMETTNNSNSKVGKWKRMHRLITFSRNC